MYQNIVHTKIYIESHTKHILYIFVYSRSCFTIYIVLPLNKIQFEDETRLTDVR